MRLPAWGKLNLVLSVGTRQTNGYHDVDTIFHSLDWHDDVHLEWSREPRETPVQLEVEGDDSVPANPSNLAWRAAVLMLEATRRAGSVRIRLTKRLPAGGGLGGGSADAAAVLLGLNALVPEPLSLQELLDAAARLGSDVPFALCGYGTARGWGRGERLAPIPQGLPLHFVLVVPEFAISTPWCYEQWSPRAHALDRGRATRMARALASGDYPAVVSGLVNDLETVVVEKHPEINAIRRTLVQAGCDAALMTGSGSCVFGVAATKDQAKAAAAKLPASVGRVVLTHSKVSEPAS